MDSFIISFLNTSLNSLETTPGIITFFLGLLFLFLGYRLKNKKLSIDEYVTVGNSQSQQLNDLKNLVKMLGEELTQARKDIMELSKRNSELRRHIYNLEMLLINHGIINKPENNNLSKKDAKEEKRC